jgi:FixJ family two-component response regulator
MAAQDAADDFHAEQIMSNAVIEETGIPPSPDIRRDDRVVLGVNADKSAAPFALIVDDQEPICRVIAMTLTQLGVESASFLTAKPAVASLDQRLPEVIFLDVALENSDAIDVIKGLHEKRYRGPIQLMSGGRLPLLEAIQRIGARHGLLLRPPLQKPFRAEAIREVIVSLGLARDTASPSISVT